MGISRAIKNYEMESESPTSFANEVLGEVDGVEGAGFQDFGDEGFGEVVPATSSPLDFLKGLLSNKTLLLAGAGALALYFARRERLI